MPEQITPSGHGLDRRVHVSTAANFRDLGGLPVAEGTISRGKVFRSASLAGLNDADRQAIAGLGITSVYDFRTAEERDTQPDRLPEDSQLHALDVLADASSSVAATIGKLRTAPETVNGLLGDGGVERMYEETYRDFVRLPSATTAYRKFFLSLASNDRQGSALFHCTAGKDRTGWAAASLLMMLGANDETIHADYLETNNDWLPKLEPLIESAAAKGVDPDLLRTALGVRLSYLDAALDQVQESYGSAENYFTVGLGLGSPTIDALRHRFIE